MVSAFNKQAKRLEIGSLNPVPREHFLELRIFERQGREVVGSPCRIQGGDVVKLKFNLEGVIPGLRKFQPTPTFNPQTADPDDFRWVLNFEEEHKGKLGKLRAAITPRLFLYNGVVRSLLRSSLLTKNAMPFRRIAQVMAVDMDVPAPLPAGLQAALLINDKAVFDFDLTK